MDIERNIDKLYTKEHLEKIGGGYCYPNEWLVRTLLGKYPNLKMPNDFKLGKQIKFLDWACGDGRNMVLLNNLGVSIYGFEITKEICRAVKKRMEMFGISAEIRVGRNSSVPFEAESFDYVVSSASLYYVDHGEHFDQSLYELARVTKKGGYVILTLAHPRTFILNEAENIGNHHYVIKKDPYGLRNGDVFYVFENRRHIRKKLGVYFKDICIGLLNEDYYGMNIRLWLVVAKRKSLKPIEQKNSLLV